MTTASDAMGDDNWLQVYIVEAARKNVCTQIHCTTSGATEFRQGVLNAFAKAAGRQPGFGLDRAIAIEIARALAAVHPITDDSSKFEAALRCLLFDLWTGIPIMDLEVETILRGTWSGEVLRGMQEHHKAREEHRRALEEYQDPVNVRKRRDEKKRLKQENHQARLALKKERDRIWHMRHGEDASNGKRNQGTKETD